MQREERETKKASFFKVMIRDFAEKMHIPMQFLLDFCRELCSIHVAILNGPRGTGWHVRLKVEDGRMFFGCGWREFIKHHDIKGGYFLIFRYDGQSNFNVEVFDTSGCLKKYPCVDEGKRLKAGKEKEVVERESSHPNPKHYHFKAVINRSNLTKPYMCIPKEFKLTNDLQIGRAMTLRDPVQRLWKVTIDCWRYRCSTFFRSGWTEFAVANGLEIGDVCFFEIVPSKKDVLDVHIGRRATKVKND